MQATRGLRYGRLVTVAGALALGAGLLATAGLGQQSESNTAVLPSAIQQLLPEPGTVVRPQEDVGADLRDDLFGVLRIDGNDAEHEVPEDQYNRLADLGRVVFRPGRGKQIEALEPGMHTATVLYWPRVAERDAATTETSSYTWEFKVG